MKSQKLDSFLQKVINYSFYSLFFFVPFIWYAASSELFEFNKMVATYALTAVITGAWLSRTLLNNKFIFQKTVLDIPLLLFLLSQSISTITSIDRHTSIWGYYSRSNGGLLSILSYLLLYWAYVSNIEKENVKLHVKALLASSLIISVYAILEHFGRSFSCILLKGEFNDACWVQDVQNRVFATLGQPNWLAAWLVAIAPLVWSLSKLKFKIGASSLIFAALLFTKSRSGLLAFSATSGVFWFLSFLTSKNRPSLLKPFVICNLSFVILLAIFGTPWTPRLQDLLPKPLPSSVISHESSVIPPSGTVLESGGTESFTIRQIVWKGAINVWRAYPLFGSGVETFAYSYYQYRPVEHNLTSEWDFLYNKAHNEYLNYLATTGTVGLISYLLVIITFLFSCISRLKSAPGRELKFATAQQQTMFITAGYVGILVTNYAGFSVVPTATLFYLFPAMAWVETGHRTLGSQHRKEKITRRRIVILAFIVGCVLYTLFQISNIWLADLKYSEADKFVRRGLPHYAAAPLGDAIDLRPDEPLYYDKYATALSQISAGLFEEEDATRAADIASDADKLETKALFISPRNIPIIKSAHTNYLLLGGIDEKYLKKSHDLIEYLSALSPTDPRVFYLLGASYRRLGEKEKAIAAIKKAIELKSDYPEPRELLVQLETDD